VAGEEAEEEWDMTSGGPSIRGACPADPSSLELEKKISERAG